MPGLLEPVVGQNGPEQVEALLHPVLGVVLLQHLIILTGSSKEHYQKNILKTVDPLLPLSSLATNIYLKKTVSMVVMQGRWYCLP